MQYCVLFVHDVCWYMKYNTTCNLFSKKSVSRDKGFAATAAAAATYDDAAATAARIAACRMNAHQQRHTIV